MQSWQLINIFKTKHEKYQTVQRQLPSSMWKWTPDRWIDNGHIGIRKPSLISDMYMYMCMLLLYETLCQYGSHVIQKTDTNSDAYLCY